MLAAERYYNMLLSCRYKSALMMALFFSTLLYF